jgi:hypothetical protein
LPVPTGGDSVHLRGGHTTSKHRLTDAIALLSQPPSARLTSGHPKGVLGMVQNSPPSRDASTDQAAPPNGCIPGNSTKHRCQTKSQLITSRGYTVLDIVISDSLTSRRRCRAGGKGGLELIQAVGGLKALVWSLPPDSRRPLNAA